MYFRQIEGVKFMDKLSFPPCTRDIFSQRKERKKGEKGNFFRENARGESSN